MALSTKAYTSLKPVRPDEEERLAAFGALLRRFREAAGVSRRILGVEAQLSAQHLGDLEWGWRRTRASTIARVAGALARLDPDLDDGDAAVIEEALVEAIGESLAGESKYARAQEKRREWRAKRDFDRLVEEDYVTARLKKELRAEIEAEAERLVVAKVWAKHLAAERAKAKRRVGKEVVVKPAVAGDQAKRKSR